MESVLVQQSLDSVFNKGLPRSPEAERSVIGSILINSRVLSRVEALGLKPEDFTGEDTRVLFRTFQEIAASGQELGDIVTIKDELRRRQKLDAIGGAAALVSFVDPVPDVANAERYAGIVMEASTNRKVIRAYSDALQFVGKIPASQLVAETTERLYDIISKEFDDASPVTVDKMVGDLVEEIKRRKQEADYLTGITTGLSTLDAYTLGYQPGVLTVIGAYTSVGKTALGLDMGIKALEAPGNEKLHILYVALEMTRKMLCYRLLANTAGENLHYVRTGLVTDEGLKRVERGGERLMSLGNRLHVTDAAFDIQQIRAIARSLAQQGKLGLLFVDYLQLVEGEDGETREREVNLVGKSLLRLAKQLNIPVIAFAQLNEGVVNREGHEPKIHDMRESRAINQHARTVILLNRPWMYDKPENDPMIKPCLTYLHIEKNSESKTGKIQLHFNAAIQRFEDGGCREGCEYFDKSKEANVTWL